jgi:hypothetical protein
MTAKGVGSDAWLWKNHKALSRVQKGIAEARQGKHAQSPNLVTAAKLAAKIKD